LRTVARAIVLQSRVPAPAARRTWVDWFVGISLSFRRAVLSHRNAARSPKCRKTPRHRER
jgi:TetR/AcrR family transcriptional regulator, tetracycline repressor protein